jgi:hypothetical protein
MRPTAERRSTRLRVVHCVVLACAIAGVSAPARAQAPSCAWGDGVALPGVDGREALITDDGAAGVVAVVWTAVGSGPPSQNQLRFFHVLEQGRLDPSLPADGVLLVNGAVDLPERPELTALRILADGQGGAYILFTNCNSTTAHMRCYELADMRLLHVTAAGTPAPGWPALGLLFDPAPGIYVDPARTIDIVLDGGSAPGAPSGVIVAWVPYGTTSPVLAQRFAPDAAPYWPGGTSGITVLDAQPSRYYLAIGADHAGGCVVVSQQLLNAPSTQVELRAGRVSSTGTSLWTTAGKPVFNLPNYSASSAAVATDASGRSFVSLVMFPATTGQPHYFTQLLTPAGARAWGPFAIELGLNTYTYEGNTALAGPSGFVSMHTDPDGSPRFQLQDEFGTTYWAGADGIPAGWTSPPAPQVPLLSAEGHLISLFPSSDAVTSGVRAIELDEGGDVAPGWPADGVSICAGVPGQYVTGAMVNDGHVFVAVGGGYGAPVVVQRLSRSVLAVGADLPSRPLEFSPPAPNPSRGDWAVRLALRAESRTTLEAFDVAGRRALTADLGTLTAGRHALAVPGGASLPPGVYRVRVRAGAFAAERVLVRVR